MQSAPCHQNNNQKYTHFSHALRTIWKEEGFKGFFAGNLNKIKDIEQMSSLFRFFIRYFSLFLSTPKRKLMNMDLVK